MKYQCERKINAQDRDLGSREILKNEKDLVWYAAEVNTSIRPGWFYHTYEDNQVRPLEKLIDIYEKSVGGNATFLLNIPPCPTGLFHKNDVERLKELGEYLKKTYAKNLLNEAVEVRTTEGDVYERYIRWEKPVQNERMSVLYYTVRNHPKELLMPKYHHRYYSQTKYHL